VCIVGAGAAGITLARECIKQPFRVCLLESGGLDYNEDIQSLYQGENTGLPYYPLDASRLRYFGGTTNHWAGMCRPLDDIDFAARAWIPYSGWPFGRSHLDPFYARAHLICQLGSFTYDTGAWETPDTPRFPLSSDRVMTKITQQSPPTRFGQVYQDEIVRADNVITYLHANAVEVETADTAQTVTRLRVACLQGPQFWVAARQFILATGAIENARLLLLSNKAQSAGLGNQNDLVGRFFMEHPSFESGALLPSAAHLATALHFSKIDRMQGVPVTRSLTL
jgi:choline dehydrogenase-like flavoprotein